MNAKRLLALLLALVMVLSLAACGGKKDEPATEEPAAEGEAAPAEGEGEAEEAEEPEEPAEAEGEAEEPAEAETAEGGYTGPDWEAIDAMDYDDASDAVYANNLGEFNEYYQTAKEELDDTDVRLALMAIAEAKLMESGAFVPIYGDGGSYAMTRVVPRSSTTTSWGLDEYRYDTTIVANELLKSEDRTALVGLWGEAEDAAAYIEAAKAYLEEHGYTLSDTYNYNNATYEPATWDVIATSYTQDSIFVAPTYTGLMQYDAKNVLQPSLAESYEVSEDGTVYTFHLRDGIKWVDQQGREYADITADDWVASMEHLIDNNDALGYLMTSTDGCGIKNYDAFLAGEVTDFAEVGVKAIDDKTLEYTLENKFPAFITMMGYGCFAPLNRQFYTEHGGTFSAEGQEYTSGDYGTSPENILYCGAYLVTNYTAKNICSYVANPTYWAADSVNTPNLNLLYNDGSDVMRVYNDTKSGDFSAGGFNASALEVATKEIPDGETETYFDLYHYTTTNSATTYCGWMNFNRGIWHNYNDETKMVSPQTEEDAARTHQAMNNQHFRLAIAFGLDRGAYNAAQVGEDLKYASLKNAYVTGSFAQLANDVTVDINGTATDFAAGTYYGAIMQAQIDADGFPIKVWDPAADDGVGSGDGFDGWYNVDNCKAQLDQAIAELAQVGVEISKDDPIQIDYPYAAYNDTMTKMANVLKQSVEESTEGCIRINLIPGEDSTTRQSADYTFGTGAEANFDISLGSGWGPDYGDPQTFLDTIQPYGYMTKNLGVY